MSHSIAAEPLAEAVVALLQSHGLPTGDLASRPCLELYGSRQAGSLSGIVGVEVLGTDGLLRSLAVAPDARGRGLGVALLRFVEARAQQGGVRELYLLTETAAEFFRRNGYEPTHRGQVPAAIAATPEFSSLCPDTATCMKKSL